MSLRLIRVQEAAMLVPLEVLILEDNPDDAELTIHALRRAGFAPEWRRVQTEADYVAHLGPSLDVVLADYNMPEFDASRALAILKAKGFDIPFIVVSGTIGEESAVAMVKDGAADYLLKDRLTRLGSAITRALEEKRTREEKRQAEEALRESEARLRQVQKMEVVGQLAGGIAHDFNNILQTIVGHSEILLEGLIAEDPLRQDVHDIHAAAERAVGLTRQLLAFSRKQVIAPRLVNLNALVGELERMLQRMIGEDIRIVTHFAGDLKKVRADVGQIEQIVMNLVTNARDAMPSGGELTISTSNVTVRGPDVVLMGRGRIGQFVRMTVKDTGIGMDKETRQRIFEPFFTTKGLGRGTGLGLAVVYGIVGQHDGWINVESEVGQGSSFDLYLPMCPEADSLGEGAAAHAPQLRLCAAGHGERVLVVEDEGTIRTLTAHVLRDKGYQVSVAEKGLDALALFEHENGRFDMLISDVVLPDLSGLDLAEKIHAQKPAIPILLCSGYSDERSRWGTISEKGFRFLQKPFPLSLLLNTVETMLTTSPTSPSAPQ
jgi:two-component system, cell cycle sensor histidine kinase and response regulator CckA